MEESISTLDKSPSLLANRRQQTGLYSPASLSELL